jgi:hypothetical protein
MARSHRSGGTQVSSHCHEHTGLSRAVTRGRSETEARHRSSGRSPPPPSKRHRR